MKKEILPPIHNPDNVPLHDVPEESSLYEELAESQESQPRYEKAARGLAKKAFEQFEVSDNEDTFEEAAIEREIQELRAEIVTYRDDARKNAYIHIELLNKSAEQLHALSEIVKQGGFESLDRLHHEILDVREVIEKEQRLSEHDEMIRFDAAHSLATRKDSVDTRIKDSTKKLDRLAVGIHGVIDNDAELLAEIDMISRSGDRQLLVRQVDDVVAKLRNRANNFYNQPSAELVGILQTIARDIDAE